MGVITLALVTAGSIHTFTVPLWVKFAAAGAMALGTYSGGWRIMRTLGRRIIQVDPPRGFAADTTSSIVLLTAAHFGCTGFDDARHHLVGAWASVLPAGSPPCGGAWPATS